MFGYRPENHIDIQVLLDRSGSMEAIRRQTVDGFADFIAKQRTVPGDCRVTLAQFDTVYETVYRQRPLHKVPPLQLHPRGGTALLDAMGRLITETADRLQRQQHQPRQVLMVIITDGMENSSREFRRPDVLSLVKHYTATADWQFVYLGANQDAIQEAGQLGISPEAAMTYAGTALGTQNAWRALNNAVCQHRLSRRPRAHGDFFTAEQRRDARRD